MSIGFSIHEGLKGLFKARLAITISITSITLSMLLIGIFIILGINLQTWIEIIRDKIEVELFIESGTTEKEVEILVSRILQTEGVDSIQIVSKEQAAEKFKEEFGQDVFEILDYNPFPASIIIVLKKTYRTPREVSKLKSKLELLQNVEEVFYKRPLLEKIDQSIKIITIIAGIIGIIITVITVVLIYNTIRLTIYARREMIQIMRLVGATESFIKRPFLVEGIIQGLIGSVLSSVMIFYGIKLLIRYIYPYIGYDPAIFAGLIIFGICIGFFSSYMSVGKYLKII